eukprot:EG_transcript_63135
MELRGRYRPLLRAPVNVRFLFPTFLPPHEAGSPRPQPPNPESTSVGPAESLQRRGSVNRSVPASSPATAKPPATPPAAPVAGSPPQPTPSRRAGTPSLAPAAAGSPS